MKVCPRCYAINDDEANFCAICGYRFPEEKTIRIPPPDQTRKVKKIKLTLEDSFLDTQSATKPQKQPKAQPSQTESVQQNNIIRQKIIEKEKRVIRTVTIVAVIVTILLLTPLALNGITIHYIPRGVVPLNAQQLDSVLGGSWITTNISTKGAVLTYVSTHILHTNININATAYYQYFGYDAYDLVDVYLQFPNETLAKQFYLNYTNGVITTSINTYPATILQSNTAIAGIAQFGNYFIYIEVYSANGSLIPYTSAQIIQLIQNMEVT